ncbi:MAG TPA: arginine deiminase-related protein [Pyrinomonadaceae bacterium]|nr:arginine deiminase-related protein [Pyrinomonadaceae bacterium]
MLKAITRAVSRNIGSCELTFRQRERLDLDRAVRQHAAYCDLLRRRKAEVITLEASDENPDCCFVADAAVILDEIAIIASPGAASRRGEVAAIEESLAPQREVARISLPATLDGGDVLTLGKHIFVGRSKRTNAEGIEALSRITRPFGYTVSPVSVMRSLHLTTACSAINEETVLINSLWIDRDAFRRQWVLEVPEDEPWAASTMRIGASCVCVEAGAPRTLELVGKHCGDVEVLDISEFRKAEGSLPCLSLLFHETNTAKPAGYQNKEAIYA